MKEERFNIFLLNSLYNEPIPEDEGLTLAEWREGYHYCYDWDGLFISPEDAEIEVCSCHPKGGLL